MKNENPKPSGLGPQDLHPGEIGDGVFLLGVGGEMGKPGWLLRLHSAWDLYQDFKENFMGTHPRQIYEYDLHHKLCKPGFHRWLWKQADCEARLAENPHAVQGPHGLYYDGP